MPRKKLMRFAELKNFNNVAENNQADAKARLQKFLAKNKNIILELGCGKGEYALALAQKFPNKKIVGIDIQGERLWFGAKSAQDRKITNVFFLREQIENIENYFNPHSISQIWLTFPDPQPKKRQAKKRLTSARFLKIYQKLLNNRDRGLIHFKTDDYKFFKHSQQSVRYFGGKIIAKKSDLYSNQKIPSLLQIKTYYENKYLEKGKKIYYLQFSL
ncbi:MAG: tRNA (guanosine(46)-N7)-methyltransferase TrmB [Patescibacteria group bacterium]|nr:tRNA (guanosine(46)-N7)-methyltransferase TrmB [Patescibacteria group bacterium]